MGSMFSVTCCSTERLNQSRPVTGTTEQVVSNCKDTLSDQQKPDDVRSVVGSLPDLVTMGGTSPCWISFLQK